MNSIHPAGRTREGIAAVIACSHRNRRGYFPAVPRLPRGTLPGCSAEEEIQLIGAANHPRRNAAVTASCARRPVRTNSSYQDYEPRARPSARGFTCLQNCMCGEGKETPVGVEPTAQCFAGNLPGRRAASWLLSFGRELLFLSAVGLAPYWPCWQSVTSNPTDPRSPDSRRLCFRGDVDEHCHRLSLCSSLGVAGGTQVGFAQLVEIRYLIGGQPPFASTDDLPAVVPTAVVLAQFHGAPGFGVRFGNPRHQHELASFRPS